MKHEITPKTTLPTTTLIDACYAEWKAIMERAKIMMRPLSVEDTKRLRELARAMRDLNAMLRPEDTMDTLIIIKPKLPPLPEG